jgi:hypothetical protein
MRLEKRAGQAVPDQEAQKQQQRDQVMKRASSFKAVFKSPGAEDVLADLEHFCFAKRTTLDAHESNMAACEGRRQVWLHIQQLLNLDIT